MWVTGWVNFFEDTQISTEDVGSGATHYDLNLNKPPIIITSFILHYIVNGNSYTGVSDSDGNITGDYISSGHIGEDGIGSVDFTEQADSVTCDYISKGILTAIIDCITTKDKTYDALIAVSDGSTTAYSVNLNPNIKFGQCRIKFRYSNDVIYVWDNGEGSFEHDLIISSSLDYATGDLSITFKYAPDNGTDITTKYITDAIDGKDWIILYDNDNKYILKNSGYSTKDLIHIGIRSYKHVSDDVYNLEMYTDSCHDDDGGWLQNYSKLRDEVNISYNSTYDAYNGLPKLPCVPLNIQYWISSTKQRVVIVLNCGGVYELGIIGHGIRLAGPDSYTNPEVAIGTTSAVDCTSSNTTQHSFLYDEYSIIKNKKVIEQSL